MFNWLRGRRLSKEARKKLLIVQARSEEAIIETHVENVLELMEMLAGEVDADRALEEYAGLMPMDEVVASTVANRVLARSHGPQAGGRGPRFENVFREDRR
jgi:hypothetical protein